jgi:hypothetical protein
VAERVPPRLGIAYFGNRYPHHAREDLRAIAAVGASFVVHTMSEDDLRWNPGTITELVTIGRDLGLESWLTPWAVGGVFGGEASSRAIGDHPEAWQRDNRGNRLPALCPRQPAFRALMDLWLDAAAQSGASVVQWDEPHLSVPRSDGPGRWACSCDACAEAFRERFGRDMPGAWDEQVALATHDLLAGALAWLVTGAADRGLDSAVVLLADESYSHEGWQAAASLPGVRYFGCTPYWLFANVPPQERGAYIRLWAQRTLDATAGTGAAPLGWVQAFQVPGGREGEVAESALDLDRAGMQAIAAWSYLACAPMSGLAPDDPDATWAAVCGAFAQISGSGAGRPGETAEWT